MPHPQQLKPTEAGRSGTAHSLGHKMLAFCRQLPWKPKMHIKTRGFGEALPINSSAKANKSQSLFQCISTVSAAKVAEILIATGCPGKWWGLHPWKCSKTV